MPTVVCDGVAAAGIGWHGAAGDCADRAGALVPARRHAERDSVPVLAAVAGEVLPAVAAAAVRTYDVGADDAAGVGAAGAIAVRPALVMSVRA